MNTTSRTDLSLDVSSSGAGQVRASRRRVAAALLLAGFGLLPAACSSVYYGTLETFGIEKRDVLADRVKEGRDAQEEAGEEFKTTLEAFKAATGYDGGALEATYNKLNSRYEDCAAAAEEVSDRIDSIESVASDLFSEWQQEADEYTNPELRQKSEALLNQTKDRYKDLIAAMKKAESQMPPVLAAFKDQVLFLKHNLNAQAIASLQSNVAGIEKDVTRLVADMQASIAEADEFIKTLG